MFEIQYTHGSGAVRKHPAGILYVSLLVNEGKRRGRRKILIGIVHRSLQTPFVQDLPAFARGDSEHESRLTRLVAKPLV